MSCSEMKQQLRSNRARAAAEAAHLLQVVLRLQRQGRREELFKHRHCKLTQHFSQCPQTLFIRPARGSNAASTQLVHRAMRRRGDLKKKSQKSLEVGKG